MLQSLQPRDIYNLRRGANSSTLKISKRTQKVYVSDSRMCISHLSGIFSEQQSLRAFLGTKSHSHRGPHLEKTNFKVELAGPNKPTVAVGGPSSDMLIQKLHSYIAPETSV